MATKAELIRAKASETMLDITSSADNWVDFQINTAFLYKYNFPDKVAIHSQRPDATLCAPFGTWTGRLNRRIKQGAKGIGLLHGDKLNYVFDITDTETAQTSPAITVYAFDQNTANAALDFFLLPKQQDQSFYIKLHSCITEQVHLYATLNNIAVTNFIAQNNNAEFSINDFKEIAAYSAEVHILTRCGFNKADIAKLISPNAFEKFSLATFTKLQIHIGETSSEVSEKVLRQMENTKKQTIRKTRLATNEKIQDNSIKPTTPIKQEGLQNERNETTLGRPDIRGGTGRTAVPQPIGGNTIRPASTGQMGTGETDLLKGTSETNVPQHGHDRRTGITSNGDSGSGSGNVPEHTERDDESRKSERTGQERHPSMGGLDEQHSGQSKGDSKQRLDLPRSSQQLNLADIVQPKETIPSAVLVSTPSPPPISTPEPTLTADNYRITNDSLGVGGMKTKYALNTEAIRTLKEIEAGGFSFATKEQQETLSKYIGWGAMPQAFDEHNTSWAKEYTELAGLLSPAEYEAARASTLNAHYTSPLVIRNIYKVLEQMDFAQGNMLEPALGAGNFFGLLPDSMQNATLYGSELDSVTGRIAQLLYPKANISVCGYENTTFPDNFFDVAVGNVPFGAYGVNDPAYNKLKFSIHDYFFAKTLDKLRPNGVMAFITSKYTMDSKATKVREYIGSRANLLGAIRLPNTAFKANAGTEVTTDILFLQKREGIAPELPSWVKLGSTWDNIPLNQYYVNNPHMLMGEMIFDSSRYGNDSDTACVLAEGDTLELLLQRALPHIKNPRGNPFADSMEQDKIGDVIASIPADLPSSKVNICVNNIFKIWEETKADRSAQLVFCDLSTPKSAPPIEMLQQAENGIPPDTALKYGVYWDVKLKLMQQGIPADEIVFIHDAKTDAQKALLFGNVRSGKVRVLLGSTAKMGAGTNVQKKLIALHHLDVPWRPSDIEQREGRILRQGNGNKEVGIYRYATEGTFDAYMWSILEAKQKFISQVMTSKSPARSCEDIDESVLSYAEVKALATGDIRIREKCDLEVDVSRLSTLYSGYTNERYRLEDLLGKVYPAQISTAEELVRGFNKDIRQYAQHGADFNIKLGGKSYTSSVDANKALYKKLQLFKSYIDKTQNINIGTFAGIPMSVTYDEWHKQYTLNVQGALTHPVALGADEGSNNITRLLNAMERMPEELDVCRKSIVSLKEKSESAKKEVAKPFAYTDEFKSKKERLEELNAELSTNENAPDLAPEGTTLDAGSITATLEIKEGPNTSIEPFER